MDTSDRLLADATQRYERAANAQAYWDTIIARGVAGLTLDDEPVAKLRRWLGPHRLAELERVDALRISGKGAVAADALDTNIAYPPGWAVAFLDQARVDSALDGLGAVAQPLNTLGAELTSFGEFTWVGEGQPAPVVLGATNSAVVSPFKFGGIAAGTKELLLHSNPAVRAVVQRAALRELRVAGNRLAFDPTIAATADNPASLTYGATEIASSGSTAEAIEQDCRDLLTTIANGEPERPRFVLSRRAVSTLAAARHSTAGVSVFPGLTGPAPSILGVPCIVGSGVPDVIVAVDAAGVALADGGIDLQLSLAASLQMADTPSGAAALTSLFQSGLIAIQARRWVNWRARTGAVAWRSLPLTGSPLL